MSSANSFDLGKSKILLFGEAENIGNKYFSPFIATLFNYLPNDKILDWSKVKAFPDDKLNAIKEWKFVLGREDNIVGKREKAGNQHFLFFPQLFQKASFTEVLKDVYRVV